MSFLSFLGFGKMVEDGAKVLEFPKPKAVEPVQPPAPPKPKAPEEHYRVGFDSEGRTTLTLLTNYGSSMTLSMNRTACEQLIRMLRATYQDDEDTPDDDPDGGLPVPEEQKVA